MFKMMSGFWRGITRRIIEAIVEIVLDYLSASRKRSGQAGLEKKSKK